MDTLLTAGPHICECSPARHPHNYDSRCPQGSISKPSLWGQFLRRRRLHSLPWGTAGIPGAQEEGEARNLPVEGVVFT